MYAHARCRRRGIRCESGTVPQRCTCAAPVRTPVSPRTCRQRARPSGPGAQTSGPRGWAGGRGARVPLRACLPARALAPSPRPRAERGRAPRDHRASRSGLSQPSCRRSPSDGPGTALLRTLTELTADLPDTDPGRVAAAALRGRHAGVRTTAELRELATEAAAGLIAEDPAYSRLAARLLTLAIARRGRRPGRDVLLRVRRGRATARA